MSPAYKRARQAQEFAQATVVAVLSGSPIADACAPHLTKPHVECLTLESTLSDQEPRDGTTQLCVAARALLCTLRLTPTTLHRGRSRPR